MGIIYALVDPDTGNVRYVGQTNNWNKRYAEHCRLSNNLGKTHRATWLRSILDAGLKPGWRILEESADLNAAEVKWIKHYRDSGCPLVNGNEGGVDLSHASKVRAASEWAGRQTPLQHHQIEISRTISFLRKRGYAERADRLASRLADARDAIAKVRAHSGRDGINRMNRALAKSMA